MEDEYEDDIKSCQEEDDVESCPYCAWGCKHCLMTEW